MKLAAFPLLLVLALPARARQQIVRTVTCPDDSLQACIDAAQDGDTIHVGPGVYNESLDFRGKALHVRALEGPTMTVIDATGLAAPAVKFHGQEGPGSWLQGFTIRGGSGEHPRPGGGISCVDFELSTGSARPRITDCIVRDNRSLSGGGGVFGAATLERCVISGNVAERGDGGGVCGAQLLRHCVLANNTALSGPGGGLSVPGGDVRVEDCLFLENASRTSGRGGGVYVAAGVRLELERSILAGNLADPGGVEHGLGGALFAEPGARVSLSSCTVSANRATSKIGAGVGSLSGSFLMVDSIVWANDPPADLTAATTIQYSLVEGGAAGTGVIGADPLFVDPLGHDFHLGARSPAIDAGNPAHRDPDGSRADLGAQYQRLLYARENANEELLAEPGWPELSSWLGGVQHLRLNAGPAQAGHAYALVGLSSNLRMILFLGTLDGNGRADVSPRLERDVSPAFLGRSLRSIAIVFDPIGGVISSNLEPLLVVP